MKRLFVVGDVHGCSEELVKLLAITDAVVTQEDEYVFLGDYIDRGPDSKGVIDILITRKDSKIKHTFLLGNHEEMMIQRDENNWAINGGVETLASYGIETKDFGKWVDRIPEDHWNFLRNLGLRYQVGRTVCVHASIDPGYCLLQQSRSEQIWGRRFVKYTGGYAGDIKVIHGHTPEYSIREAPNQIGIDTAAVFGGKLTCAVIEPETGDMVNVFQVKSGFSY